MTIDLCNQCSLCLCFRFASWVRPRGLDTSTRSVQPWQRRMRGGFATSPSLPCSQQPGGRSQSAARRPVKRTCGHRQNALGVCRWVHRLGPWTVNDESKLSHSIQLILFIRLSNSFFFFLSMRFIQLLVFFCILLCIEGGGQLYCPHFSICSRLMNFCIRGHKQH